MKFLDKKIIKTFYIKILRQTETPEVIAKSAAIGLFVAFFIPIGLQIPFALLLAYLFRAKKIISLIFTLPTNIYTVFFIYPLQCWVGGKILNIPLKFSMLLSTFHNILNNFSFVDFLELGIEIIISFFAGGLIFGTISGIIGYFTIYGMIVSYRERKKLKPRKKVLEFENSYIQNNNQT